MSERRRLPVLSIVGSSGPIEDELRREAERVGELAMERGFRLVCGGRDGVMEAVCAGAHRSPAWLEGRVVGILPGTKLDDANEWLDFAIPTGLGVSRNTLVVAAANVVLALGGGAGTLSEIALAWQIGRPVIALDLGEGWAARLAGTAIDARRADTVVRALDAESAIREAQRLIQA